VGVRSGQAAVVVALGAALLATPGCSVGGGEGRRPEPPEPVLRIWLPGIVHWTGDRRELAMQLENGTARSVRIEAPAARRVRVSLFLGPGPESACGVEPDSSKVPGPAVEIGPGEALPVRIDLAPACGRLPPGDYRYEVTYQAPGVEGGPPLHLRSSYGHVLVEAALPVDQGSLGSGSARP
jgi:hypothetical protein